MKSEHSNSRIDALSWWVNLTDDQKQYYAQTFNKLRPNWDLSMIDKSSSVIESIYLNVKKDEFIRNHPMIFKWTGKLDVLKAQRSVYEAENRPKEFINELTYTILHIEEFLGDLRKILETE